MNCVYVENGVVTKVAIWGECPSGWIESDAGKGYLHDSDTGEFTAPVNEEEEKTSDEQIAELEASLTARNLRSALLGDEYAIAKVQEVEDAIELLRE